MNRKFIFLLLSLPTCANAQFLPLDDALRATYTACVDIEDKLTDLKKMAGINTAITATGTGLGVGAVAVGIAKAKTDYSLADKFQQIKDLSYGYQGDDPTDEDIRNFTNSIQTEITTETMEQRRRAISQTTALPQEDKDLQDKSKRLGNWRTGLMATNTATNIGGAIIAGNNRVDDDLQNQINNCRASVKILKDSILAARANGEDITEAEQIASVCGEYEYTDISSINNKAKGAFVSSIVGATTGLAGTVTSGIANSKGVRKDDDYDTKDWDKEKKLNTAANVLAGAATISSGVATVFNATQINAIKNVAQVAEKCTEVLK